MEKTVFQKRQNWPLCAPRRPRSGVWWNASRGFQGSAWAFEGACADADAVLHRWQAHAGASACARNGARFHRGPATTTQPQQRWSAHRRCGNRPARAAQRSWLFLSVSKAGGAAKQSVQAVDNLKAPVPWCGDQAAEPLHLLRLQSNATGSQCSAVTGKCPAAARQATRARTVPVGGGSGMCMAGKASAGRCCAWQGQAVKQLLQASGRHRTAGGPASTHLMCKKHGLPSALHWTGSAASS